MPLRRLRRLLASSCRTQLKNNSFQLKSIKRNYFTLNQLRFDWRMKESRLKKKKTRRQEEKQQNFYSVLRFGQTDCRQTKQETERDRDIERARGVERSLVSFFWELLLRMLIIMIYGPSWRGARYKIRLRTSSFAFLRRRFFQSQQIDLTVVLKCWQSATWVVSKKTTAEEARAEEKEEVPAELYECPTESCVYAK